MKRNQLKQRTIQQLQIKQYSPNPLFYSTTIIPTQSRQQLTPKHTLSNKSHFTTHNHSHKQILKKNLESIKKSIFKSLQPSPLHPVEPKHTLRINPEINKPAGNLKKPKLMLIDELCHTGRTEADTTKSTKCHTPKAFIPVQQSRISEYRNIRQVGKGRFGEVYLSVHVRSGFIGALKVLRKSEVLNQEPSKRQRILSQIVSQIKIQWILDHPNLIKLYDYFWDEENVYLFVELGTEGHLFDLLEKRVNFTEESVSIIIRQITEGIQFMHNNCFIHRDIKLENIVFTHGMAKICDFGWSVYEPRQFRKTICGTPLYMSPQILKGQKYNDKVDIWALGALAHQLFTGENPFRVKRKQDLDNIIYMDFQMSKGSPEIRSFINFVLTKEPSKRPSAQIMLKHPFISKYEDLQTSEQICDQAYKRQL